MKNFAKKSSIKEELENFDIKKILNEDYFEKILRASKQNFQNNQVPSVDVSF